MQIKFSEYSFKNIIINSSMWKKTYNTGLSCINFTEYPPSTMIGRPRKLVETAFLLYKLSNTWIKRLELIVTYALQFSLNEKMSFIV
jgi:hypothetical protein